jgi:hypothetical protein
MTGNPEVTPKEVFLWKRSARLPSAHDLIHALWTSLRSSDFGHLVSIADVGGARQLS